MDTTRQTNQQHLLTLEQVAQACSVSTRTVRRWVGRGRLPLVVLPERNYRVRASDLEQFIGEHQTGKGTAECPA
jgi:excisionase family DNA binding protein